MPVLERAGIRAIKSHLITLLWLPAWQKYAQSNLPDLDFWSFLGVSGRKIPQQHMQVSNRSTIHQNLLRYYYKVITGKDTRAENLEENLYNLDRDKNLCALVKNQDYYKFACLP